MMNTGDTAAVFRSGSDDALSDRTGHRETYNVWFIDEDSPVAYIKGRDYTTVWHEKWGILFANNSNGTRQLIPWTSIKIVYIEAL